MKLQQNPLFVYQFYTSGAYRLRQYRFVTYAILISIAIGYLFFFTMFVQFQPGLGASGTLTLLLTCIVAPLMGYRLFSQEYERATWEFLAITPMSARDILLGKWGAAVARWTLLLLLLIPLLWVASLDNLSILFWEEPGTVGWLLTLLTIWSWGVFLVSFSSWLSLRVRNTIAVVGIIFTIQACLLLLLPLVISIIGGWQGISADWRSVVVLSLREGWEWWILSFYTGDIVWMLNPFQVISEWSGVVDFSYRSDSEHYQRLLMMLWGIVQSGVYLTGSAIFAFLTYSKIRKEWRKR